MIRRCYLVLDEWFNKNNYIERQKSVAVKVKDIVITLDLLINFDKCQDETSNMFNAFPEMHHDLWSTYGTFDSVTT